MSDIFLSYARADHATAAALATHLEAAGYSVWWDRKIPAGKSFSQVIDAQLEAASCVVVLWSQASVNSTWVLEEAEEGKQRDCLIPVLLDEVRIPLGFRRIQAVPLPGKPAGWHGEALAQIVSAARSMIPSRQVHQSTPSLAPAGEKSDGRRRLVTSWFKQVLAAWRRKPVLSSLVSLVALELLALIMYLLSVIFELSLLTFSTNLSLLALGIGAWVGVAGYLRRGWSLALTGWGVAPLLFLGGDPRSVAWLEDLLDSELVLTYIGLLVLATGVIVATTRAILIARRPTAVELSVSSWILPLHVMCLLLAAASMLPIGGEVLTGNPNSCFPQPAGTVLSVAVLATGLMAGHLRRRDGRRPSPAVGMFAALVFVMLLGGQIAVSVVDATGAALPGVTISLSSLNLVAVSNSQGKVHWPAVPVGRYGVWSELEGFEGAGDRVWAPPFVGLTKRVVLAPSTTTIAAARPTMQVGLILPFSVVFLAVLHAGWVGWRGRVPRNSLLL